MASAVPMPSTLDVLVPFWGLAGGVIKVLDYAQHAIAAGVPNVVLWAPPPPAANEPIRALPVVERLFESEQVRIELIDELRSDRADPWVLFTEPTHHQLIESRFDEPLHHRLIHLVQGTRHANPEWSDGRNYRLLHRPMSRIAVSTQVAASIGPRVNTRFPTQTIVEGHDLDFFAFQAPARSASRSAFRVLYTTWKSDLGDRVAEAMSGDPLITFDAIRNDCGWPELRRRYHAADIFLCTPGPEEGFYLPGLEAMAAGCAVVTAFVGGNEAYAEEGANVLRAAFDDTATHVRALRELTGNPTVRNALMDGGRRTIAAHTLERESREFRDFLSQLTALTELPTSAELA